MTQDNHKLHLFRIFPAPKSGLTSLFFCASLWFGIASSYAQNDVNKNDSEKKGWALNSKQVVNEGNLEAVEASNKEVDADLLENTEPELTTNLAPNLAPIDDQGSTDSVIEPSPTVVDDPNSFVEYDITVGAEPIDAPILSIQPVISLSPELRESLERQFEEIQTLKETEDAFSEQLGESFLSYGRALMQAGRADESRKMLVNALHIAKINNGVNSIEQRPILRELFEMNFALGNIEKTEENLQKIIWLEKKAPSNDDISSFDLVVRLGNEYLDLYLNNPVASELSLQYLKDSIRHLNYAINRYGDRPLSEVLLPYGEIAYAHFLRGRLRNEVNNSFNQNKRRQSFSEIDKFAIRNSANVNSYSRSEEYLIDYLRKSKTEKDLVNTIQALLALGDLNLLSGRVRIANNYYDLAWSGAQNLPVTHRIVQSFEMPVKLPSFNFSVVRRPKVQTKEFESVLLSINIDDDGRVRKVAREALVEASARITSRARRRAKRFRFRPIIENGKLIPSSDYRYEVKVSVRKSKAVVAKDSAE